uniref:Uncharacterized protein n=1 Tax=Streptomyces sp. NBC_01393 TaxID=2903851 RepID=A0AAU3I1E1_9ACTN
MPSAAADPRGHRHSHSAGVIDIGVQVARYEGSGYLNSCTDWAVGSG